MSKASKPAYAIDQEAGTATYWLDRDTGQSETYSLDEMFDLLFWLKRRELELRQVIYSHSPITIKRPLTLVNGYYIGVTEDRQAVKVKASRYQEIVAQVEANTRQKWLEAQNYRDEQSSRGAGVSIVQYKPFDNTGATVETNPLREQWKLEDCPMYLVQQETEKLRNPEYWTIFHVADNLDSGKFIKLP